MATYDSSDARAASEARFELACKSLEEGIGGEGTEVDLKCGA